MKRLITAWARFNCANRFPALRGLGRSRAPLLELRAAFEEYRSAHLDLDDTSLIESFRVQHGEPWLFRFTTEHRPVQMTLTHATPIPRFRVDFGMGENADFDPDTMWVLYSDSGSARHW